MGKTLLLTVLTAFSTSLAAAPIAYSINSDSGNDSVADSLYRIDLENGAETRIATVTSFGETQLDVEGLAFAADGTLYGVDETFPMSLFAINPANAVVDNGSKVFINGLPNSSGNDFGMTFACDGNLYLTSVADKSLYRVDLAGNATLVGSLGPGIEIVALAAKGNPVELYGLGKGTTSPSLYRISTANGAASKIGTTLDAGPVNVTEYGEGGLAFDDSLQLWAITDTRQVSTVNSGQTMRVDPSTGQALEIRNTSEQGFESLAITVPRGCDVAPSGDYAQFVVQKQFLDGNDQSPVTLNIQCKTGNPIQDSITVMPNDGPFGDYEVKFIVENFTSGELDCDVWETEPDYYSAGYSCFSTGECTASEDRCTFEGVHYNQGNLCNIRNYPDPVQVSVGTEWFYGSLSEANGERVKVILECRNPLDGDGKWDNGWMRWSWRFDDETPAQQATIVPKADQSTSCRTLVKSFSSSIESESSCKNWTAVQTGDGTLACMVTNTVFFEGIPTLSQYGLLLFSVLMLLTGAVAVRRF